jgi:hypothetical protein
MLPEDETKTEDGSYANPEASHNFSANKISIDESYWHTLSHEQYGLAWVPSDVTKIPEVGALVEGLEVEGLIVGALVDGPEVEGLTVGAVVDGLEVEGWTFGDVVDLDGLL